MSLKYIKKRNGKIVKFKQDKITEAIFKAAQAVGGRNKELAASLAEQVVNYIEKNRNKNIPTVENIQDAVEKILIENGHAKTAKAFVLYREQHKNIRETTNLLRDIHVVEDYVREVDWRVRENSNMTYSLQGLNVNITEKVISNYWLNNIYPREIREAHTSGEFHIHDLGTLGAYCVGWDFEDLIKSGFRGVRGKIESKPAKHFDVALMQLVNFLYTLQGEAAGAQAVSNFDTLVAPFIKSDNLSEKEVKQSMQKFLFNMNVPTRVGFQCLSADTKILTLEGWKGYEDISEGDPIYTFNLNKKEIEEKEVTSIFKRKYSGEMYNLRNRTQDQLISPKHRVIRKEFNGNEYFLESIEEVLKLKSPIPIPVSGENKKEDYAISDEQLKLIAWILSEGSIENSGSFRVSIYQKNGKNYKEIIELLNNQNFEYSVREQEGFGKRMHIRLKPDSSKKIHQWLEGKKKKIPSYLYKLSKRQAKLFIETYVLGDGLTEEYRDRITTTDKNILEGLEALAVLSGINFVSRERKPSSKISKKLQYVLSLTTSKTDYIQEIKKVKYKDIIWSVHTENETVIAKRNGQVFFTGNTPFTNLTMDLTVPEYMKKTNVIIAGKEQESVYGDYPSEIALVNKVFAEVMLKGDAKGRPFTFPIPTYNITKDFDWSNEEYDGIWKMTSKYGTPYFANFINSDMHPDDARSMCCRLRLDKRELKKRGGGLFGSNPLTGSIGVVTINIPRIAYASKDEEEFFEKISSLMDKAMESLIIKREVLEKFTEKGLYPYSKFYLRNIKKAFGEYWKNHFSTIGLIGMNDALLNLMDSDVSTQEGIKFVEKLLDYMRDKLADYQEETGDIFNLEATPGEGTSYRLARLDKEKYPEIKTYNQEKYNKSAEPYYVNSTQLPVGFTDDIFEALKLQDSLQSRYTGGTVLHGFLGESMPSIEAVKTLVRNIAKNFKLPYYTITPTFSICPKHGYIKGKHEYCPRCDEEIIKLQKGEQIERRTIK